METNTEDFGDEVGRNFLAFQQARAGQTRWSREERSGEWLARLIANQPGIVLSFPDHALVAHKLLAAGQVDTLASVVSSGRLHGLALRFYRMALCWWCRHR